MIAGSPAVSFDSSAELSVRAERFTLAAFAEKDSFSDGNTVVTLPSRTAAILEEDRATEVCVVYTVHGLRASPYGAANNVSSAVVSFDIYAGTAAGMNPFAVTEEVNESPIASDEFVIQFVVFAGHFAQTSSGTVRQRRRLWRAGAAGQDHVGARCSWRCW